MRIEKTWTEEEIKFLKDNYKIKELSEIAKELKRTYKSVEHKKVRLGLKGFFWKEETKKKFGKSNELHPLWKGDNAGYVALHFWIRKNKPKSEFCEKCGKKKPLELANISGEYKRNVNDFEWLCVRCHINKDKVGKSYEELMGKKKAREVKKKQSDMRKGKDNPNWKGGVCSQKFVCLKCGKEIIGRKRKFCCRECCKLWEKDNGRLY